jgi:hypothetical protein
MSVVTMPLVKAARAADICQNFELICGAEDLLNDALTPAQFLDLLIENDKPSNAVRFLAYALPPREAVWWACVCLRLSAVRFSPPEEGALRALARWVLDPSEATRRAVEEAGNAVDLKTPSGLLAVGVARGLAQDPLYVPKFVATSILMVGEQASPPRTLQYLTVGIEMAGGAHHWPSLSAPAGR